MSGYARDDALKVLAFYKNFIRNCETCICACTRKAIVDIDKLRQINHEIAKLVSVHAREKQL